MKILMFIGLAIAVSCLSRAYAAPAPTLPDPWADITTFGAVCNGSTDDTVAIQNAVNAAPNGFVFVPATTLGCVSRQINITQPVTILGFQGGGSKLIQKVAGARLFSISNTSDVTITGLTLRGVPGTVLTTVDNAILATSVTRLRVKNNNFTNWQGYATVGFGLQDSELADNVLYSTSAGFRFVGGANGLVTNNTLRDPQTPNSTFTIAILFDTTQNETQYGVPTNWVVSHNIVRNWVNAQAINLHAGKHFSILGNTLDNVLNGVSLGVFVVGDTLASITVDGNVCIGTTTTGASTSTANFCFLATGLSGQPVTNVVFSNNIALQGNAIALNDQWGCYGANGVDDVSFVNNVGRSCVGSGLVFSAGGGQVVTRLRVHGNTFVDSIASPGGIATGVYLVTGASLTGDLSQNYIDNMKWGMRFDSLNPGVLAVCNTITNFTVAKYLSSGNVTLVSSCP